MQMYHKLPRLLCQHNNMPRSQQILNWLRKERCAGEVNDTLITISSCFQGFVKEFFGSISPLWSEVSTVDSNAL